MINDIAALLTERAQAVGLAPAPIDRLNVQEPFPEVRAWQSAYAWLVLWPVTRATTEAVREASDALEDAVDPLLSGDAVEYGTLLDLYGVLALPEPPDEALKDLIRQVVLRRRYYRAAVVWPVADGWAGLEEITVLDLPDIEGGETLSAYPTLGPDEAELVAIFNDRPKETGRRIAEEHINSIVGAVQ